MKMNDLLSAGSLLFYFLVVAVLVSVALLFRRPPAIPALSGLYIHCALYGHTSCFVDVTDTVRSFVRKGRTLEMCASNSDLGVDPAKGDNKHLKIFYSLDGKPLVEVVSEGTKIMLPRKRR